MPSSRELISSTTLSNTSASVIFSGISQDYQDLSIVISGRNDDTSSTFNDLRVILNNDTSTLYSYNYIQGNGSTASAANFSNTAFLFSKDVLNSSGSLGTADAFSSIEIYLPNYITTQNKAFSIFGVSERNNSLAYMTLSANLYRGSSSITRIDITAHTNNFVPNSSFYLYGLKAS